MGKDLHELPRVGDSLSYIYLERCRIEQDALSIAAWDPEGITPIPVAGLCALLLGPGTVITHAAVRAIAENGCNIVWVGEHGIRTYAAATGETRQSRNLLRQAWLATREGPRLQVVAKMYRHRFPENLPENLTLQQIRGMEGVRVRDTYARVAREYGVPWEGRTYNRHDWDMSSDINKALSAATACLYGLCHGVIVSLGYSPALGFVHTGKQLSFVYDIADLYKTELAIPAAFEAVAQHKQVILERTGFMKSTDQIERRVRYKLRTRMTTAGLLERIPQDIAKLLDVKAPPDSIDPYAEDPANPAALWEPAGGTDVMLPGMEPEGERKKK